MTDRERAAELANQIRNGGPCGLVADAMQIFKVAERELILRGLDRLATQDAAAPDQPAEVREVVSRAVAPWFMTNGPQSVRRVIDVGYTAFMAAKHPNAEDGGPSDWFTDTYPMLADVVADMRSAIIDEVCAALARFVPATARPAVGETWETPEGAVMVVPTVPTKEMIASASRSLRFGLEPRDCDKADAVASHLAMIAAVTKETTR